MTRRARPFWWHFTQAWHSPGRGRFWKRRLAKAERAYARGRTRERSVTRWRKVRYWRAGERRAIKRRYRRRERHSARQAVRVV